MLWKVVLFLSLVKGALGLRDPLDRASLRHRCCSATKSVIEFSKLCVLAYLNICHWKVKGKH